MEGGCECELREREALRAEYRAVPEGECEVDDRRPYARATLALLVRAKDSESESAIQAAQARLLYMRAASLLLLWSDMSRTRRVPVSSPDQS